MLCYVKLSYVCVFICYYHQIIYHVLKRLQAVSDYLLASSSKRFQAVWDYLLASSSKRFQTVSIYL